MQEIGEVALLSGRCAEGLKAVVRIVQRIDAIAPTLVTERRIGDHVVKGLEDIAIFELRGGERIALLDQRRGVVVQDHVHAGEACGGCILFLPVERDARSGLIAHFQ